MSGTGVISASGGAGACVPHCASCDSERRCLTCDPGYDWTNYICHLSNDNATEVNKILEGSNNFILIYVIFSDVA